jgi:hypothetical protein
MNPQPEQNYQVTPLRLFEELFEPLIDQSRNIVIRYNIQEENPGKNFGLSIVIHSVNDCKSTDEFRKKMTAMMDSSLSAVFESLQRAHNSCWQPHVEYIRNKLQDLKAIVEDESIIFNAGIGNYSRHHHFKSFTNCRLEGLKEDYSLMSGQWIRLKVEKFAEVWLQVISDTIGRIDLIYNLLKQTLQTDLISPHQVIGLIIKFNLSVPQLGYFLNLLVKTDTIDVPSRHITELIRWAAENFQSKNRDRIQPSSLRNKYSMPDLSALDFWEEKLKEWLSKIQDDRDRLTR